MRGACYAFIALKVALWHAFVCYILENEFDSGVSLPDCKAGNDGANVTSCTEADLFKAKIASSTLLYLQS